MNPLGSSQARENPDTTVVRSGAKAAGLVFFPPSVSGELPRRDGGWPQRGSVDPENGRGEADLRQVVDQVIQQLAARGTMVAKCMTVEEAAEVLRTSRWMVKKLVTRGELCYIRLGSEMLIDPASINSWRERTATRVWALPAGSAKS
jgi:excisionase family DNA binding protein